MLVVARADLDKKMARDTVMPLCPNKVFNSYLTVHHSDLTAQVAPLDP